MATATGFRLEEASQESGLDDGPESRNDASQEAKGGVGEST
jgi:hypothetical protein